VLFGIGNVSLLVAFKLKHVSQEYKWLL